MRSDYEQLRGFWKLVLCVISGNFRDSEIVWSDGMYHFVARVIGVSLGANLHNRCGIVMKEVGILFLVSGDESDYRIYYDTGELIFVFIK